MSSKSKKRTRTGTGTSESPTKSEPMSITVELSPDKSEPIPTSSSQIQISCDDDPNETEVIIGDEIFDGTELDSDTVEVEADTRLQFYSATSYDQGRFVDVRVNLETEEEDEDGDESLVTSPTKTSNQEEEEDKPKKKPKQKHREPLRLSLKDRIRCIRMCSRYKTLADVQKAWKQIYGTDAPCRKTMAALNEKFEATGSVADLVRTGRPKTTRTAATVARVEEAIRKDPNKSIRNLARDLGINQAAVHRIKRNFEDNRNTLKHENKKLKDKLNEALKRIVLLERRVAINAQENSSMSQLKLKGETVDAADVETLVFDSMPVATITGEGANLLTSHIEGRSDTNLSSILTVNGAISMPPLLRLQQQGHETIHIITLPQGSSHQLVSLDSNVPIQIPASNEASGSGS